MPPSVTQRWVWTTSRVQPVEHRVGALEGAGAGQVGGDQLGDGVGDRGPAIQPGDFDEAKRPPVELRRELLVRPSAADVPVRLAEVLVQLLGIAGMRGIVREPDLLPGRVRRLSFAAVRSGSCRSRAVVARLRLVNGDGVGNRATTRLGAIIWAEKQIGGNRKAPPPVFQRESSNPATIPARLFPPRVVDLDAEVAPRVALAAHQPYRRRVRLPRRVAGDAALRAVVALDDEFQPERRAVLRHAPKTLSSTSLCPDPTAIAFSPGTRRRVTSWVT